MVKMRTLSKDKVLQKGVSLVELLAVLAILSMAAASAASLVRATSPTMVLKSTRAMLENDLKAARNTALAKGIQLSVQIDSTGYRFSERQVSRAWPKGVTVIDEATQAIEVIFFEDGSSNGGVVTLSKGQQEAQVIINAISGRVHAPS
ncbi:MAG: GspH/FimT family pseudopilin [Pseudomonadota bacterium]